MTLAQLIHTYRISATSTRVASNPGFADGNTDFAKSASHWRVHLYSGATRRSYTVHYSMGSAHRGEPQLSDVLASLRLDAGAASAGSFEAWAGDLGFDLDSRAAERTYRACLAVNARLRRWLLADGFDDLVSADE